MKKLLAISLFLVSVNLIYAENETNEDKVAPASKTTVQKATENKEETPAPVPQKRPEGFWNFYAKQQAKLVKDNDRAMFEDVSTNVKAQEDFYSYVNENWDKKTQIPSTKPAWGAFYELNEKNQDFLRNLIRELKGKSSLTADEQKVVTLYDSYSNMEKRNKEGLAPIKNDLEKIDAIKNVADLEKYNVEATKTGGSEFYGWGVGTDLNNSKNNAIYLGSAGIGLSREYFQKDTRENRAILEEYTRYVSDMLKYLGESDTLEKAKKIVAFEKHCLLMKSVMT